MSPWEKYQPQSVSNDTSEAPWMKYASLPQEKPKMSRGEAAFTTSTNPLGFGDEIKGAIAAGYAKLAGGDVTKDIPISELYTEARDIEREKISQAREGYPIQSVATGIAGDLGIAGKALGATKLTGTTLKTIAKGGGLLGGVTAAGESEDIKNLPEDTLYGVALGTLGGVVVGKAMQGVQKSYGVIKNLLNKNKNPEKQAVNILSKYINPDDAKVVANKLINAEKNARQTLLPDISSDEVQGLTRLLGKTEGSKNIIADVFSKRTYGSNRRVANAINNKISSETYFGSLDELTKARAIVSKPLYEQAYKEGNESLNKALISKKSSTKIGDLQELIGDDRIASAISKARKDYGINKDIPDVSIESLHGARQVVDDIISQAKSPLSPEPNKARSYLELKKKINNILYKVAPTLKEADKTFAGYSALKSAQQEGLDINKYRPEELKKYISGLTAGEKDAFKIGVRENLMKNVDRTAEGLSSARKIFAKPENRDQLKIVFNNPKEYSDFAKRMSDEIRIFNTKQRILGGSRTDINLAEESQIINKVASGILTPKTSLVKNTIDAVASSIQKKYRGLDEKSAKALAEIITSRTKSIDALRKIAQKAEPDQQQIIKKSINDIMPIIIGGYAGGNLAPAEPEPLTQIE